MKGWFVVAAVLVFRFLGTRRSAAPDRRLRDAVPDFGAWLPPRNAGHGDGRSDLDAQAGRLRRTARRATAIAAAWVVLFPDGRAIPVRATGPRG